MFTRVTQGMRQLEQFNLQWEHANFDRGVLTLPTTKAGGVQYVRLNEVAKVLLREQLLDLSCLGFSEPKPGDTFGTHETSIEGATFRW